MSDEQHAPDDWTATLIARIAALREAAYRQGAHETGGSLADIGRHSVEQAQAAVDEHILTR